MVAAPAASYPQEIVFPPLRKPSVTAAVDFLHLVIPESVFGSGEDRRRRRPGSLGKRDQGYLVFYRQEHPDQEPMITTLKRPQSITAYLAAQLELPLAEHWVCTQSTQFRARRRDGQESGTCGMDSTRHLPEIVVDLDSELVTPEWRDVIAADADLVPLVSSRLADLGIHHWVLVRSSREGAHIHIPLARPDGRPLGANERTRRDVLQAAQGLCRYFAEWGADPGAVKLTQPFATPGLPRLKHGGFVPYVAACRLGPPTDVYGLLRELSRRGLLLRQTTVPARDIEFQPDDFVADLLAHAQGLSDGRKRNVYRIAVAALAKGASPEATWEALQRFNERCEVPLPQRQLEKAFKSAQRCQERHPQLWAIFRVVPWNDLRRTLGMPERGTGAVCRGGVWRPITPPRPWEDRQREHFSEVAERVVRWLAANGGHLQTSQAALADAVGSNRSTIRLVLPLLAAGGQIILATKRGRDGYTELAIPVGPTDDEKGQSRIAPIGGADGCVGGLGGGLEGTVSDREDLGVSAGPGTTPCAIELAFEAGVLKSGGLPCARESRGAASCLPVLHAVAPPVLGDPGAYAPVALDAARFPRTAAVGRWTVWCSGVVPLEGGIVAVRVSGGASSARLLVHPGRVTRAGLAERLRGALRQVPAPLRVAVWEPELPRVVDLVWVLLADLVDARGSPPDR